MSRHAKCKLPASDIPNQMPTSDRPSKIPTSGKPRKIPVSIKLPTSAVGIIVQVRKVSADVSELQKNLAAESAARNDLQECVEKLKTESAEAKKYLTQGNDRIVVRPSLHLFLRKLPCNTLPELDSLLAHIGSETNFLQWVRKSYKPCSLC